MQVDIDRIIRTIVVYFCIDTQAETLYEMIIYGDEVEIRRAIIDDGIIDMLLLKVDKDHVLNDIMFQVFENEMNYSIIGIVLWVLNIEF